MERVARVFNSFEEADEADRDWYATRSPQERLDIALELIARHHEGTDEAAKGLARVCRVVELARS